MRAALPLTLWRPPCPRSRQSRKSFGTAFSQNGGSGGALSKEQALMMNAAHLNSLYSTVLKMSTENVRPGPRPLRSRAA